MEQYDQALVNMNKEAPLVVNACNRTYVRWMKPLVGVAKINWDATLYDRTGTVGLDVIAWDHEGRALAMQCSTRKHINNPTTTETLAAWNAVVLGVQLGVIYLELEGDAMEVVQGINCVSHCSGREGPVLNNIKTLL
jgi:hypothetical protein